MYNIKNEWCDLLSITRVSLGNTRNLPSAVPEWFAIHPNFVKDVGARPQLTGKWFRIKSAEGVVYRILRFDPTLNFSSAEKTGTIAIDWDGWLSLTGYAENLSEPFSLSFHEMRATDYFWAFVKNPNPSYRLAAYASIVSLVLGLIGLLLGFLAFMDKFICLH